MIWHILKKDLRLLWPLLAVVAAVQIGNTVLLASGGQFAPGSLGPGGGYSGDFAWLSNLALPFVELLGLVIVVSAILQQDRLPGTTQDWLTRPIPRGQMLAAKMLLIVLGGLGPVLLCDISLGLIEQLPAGAVLAASLWRSLVLGCFICLPAAMVAIVTRSLTEALVFSLTVVVAIVIEVTVFSQFMSQLPLLQSAAAWTIAFILLVANVTAAAVMLPLQLRWRSTNRVRWIALAYLCALPALTLLPWDVGFGLQQGLVHPVERSPGIVRIETNRRVTFSVSGKRTEGNSITNITVPIILPEGSDSRWQLDYVYADLIDPSNGRSIDARASVALFNRGNAAKSSALLTLQMPLEAFQLARQRHVVVHAAVFLTRLWLTGKQSVAALNGRGIDEYSRCGWTVGRVVRCISTRPVGVCLDVATGVDQFEGSNRNFSCWGVSYAPRPLPLWRDPYYTHTFDDMQWVRAGPARPTVALWTYKPGAHFSRSLEFGLDTAVEQEPGVHSVDGIGTAVRFANPSGVVVDSHGNLFVVDANDSTVRKVSPDGKVITFAGQRGHTGNSDGPGNTAQFNIPAAIAIDAADNLYIADSGNGLIRKISPTGVVTTVAGNRALRGAGEPGARLSRPRAIVCGSDGSLYVIDYNGDGNPAIRKVLPNGTVIAVAGPEAQAGPAAEAGPPEGPIVENIDRD